MKFSVRIIAFPVRRIAISVVIVEVARSREESIPTVKVAKAARAAQISPARSAWQVFLLVNVRSVRDLEVSVRIMGFSVRKKALLVKKITLSVVIVEVARS